MKNRLYGFWLILWCMLCISNSARSEWSEVAKLTAFDGAADDQFGWWIAVDGNYAIIGSPYSDPKGDFSGSAYVFYREGKKWILQSKLVAPDGKPWDQFGIGVAVNGDFAVVAKSFTADSGGAYIFKREGTSWIEHTKLAPSDAQCFGMVAAISGDFVLITDFCQGAAYIFKYEGSTWTEQTKLSGTSYTFGNAADINGNYALIGAHNSNCAYIFKRSEYPDDKNWYQQTKLIPSDMNSEEFGGAVSISGDFTLIGDVGDGGHGTDSGAAYIFQRIGDNWYKHQKLIAPDAHEKHYFGRHVSIFGTRAVISAWGDDDKGSDSGAVYIFEYDGSKWNFTVKLLASDGAAGDNLGPVSINDNYLFASAPLDDDKGTDSGSVYVFKHPACPLGDLNNDCWVDFADFSLFAQHWMLPSTDIFPTSNSDGIVNMLDLEVFTNTWLTGPQ